MLMNIFQNLLSKFNSQPSPSDDFWYNPVDGSFPVQVTQDTAMRIATVFSCVKVLSQTIASLPLVTYRRLPDGGKKEAKDHPLYNLLKYQPNDVQTKYDFIQMMVGHIALRGNFYAKMILKNNGQVDALIPLNTADVRTEILDNGKPIWKYHNKGKTEIYPLGSLFRLYGLSNDGIAGLSVIQEAKATFSGAAQTQEYANNFFANAARPGGILKATMPVDAKTKEANKEQWEKMHRGARNAHKVAILYGMDWQSMSITNEEAQFLETRKFTRSEICGLFGVPPHMIGDLDRSTFSNIEHQGMSFYTNTIRSWLVCIEQCIKRDLVLEDEIFVEFNADALLRGDLKTRSEVYASALGSGGHQPWMTVNEIRAKENLNPVEGGDKLPDPPTRTATSDKPKDKPNNA